MNRIRYIILFIIVVIIAATSSWLLKKVDNQPFNIVKPTRHDMDYFLTNFDATIMNEAGKPHYIVKGAYLEHFPDDDSIDIKQPKINLFRENLPPWNMDAEQARVLNKGKLIYLNGKVTMHRPSSKTKKGKIEPEINLTTSNLTIKVERNYAETNDAVHIQTEEHHLKATGMRVYLDDGRLELLSNVNGIYHVKK